MIWLVDTNVLLRMADPTDEQSSESWLAVSKLAIGSRIFFAAQSAREFWHIACRSNQANGLALNPTETRTVFTYVTQGMSPVFESHDSYEVWNRLVDDFALRGARIFDANLLAIAWAHGVTHILTHDTKDFRMARALDITCAAPADITRA